MDPLTMSPDQLYAAYLQVWGQTYSDPTEASNAAAIFYAMSNYADAGIFVLGEDNKYYPAGQAPKNYTAVPVDPSNPNGPVTYIPTGPSTAVSTGTGTSSTPPVSMGGLAGLTTAQIVLYAVLGYFGLKALGVIR